MPADMQGSSLSNGAAWAGWIITGLVVLFLAFDGATKIIKIAPVVEATERLGVPLTSLLGIGSVLLICTALYAIPRTAILGAILLTAYLGGAVAIQVRAGSEAFPTIFPILVGLFAWTGLILRDPPLLWTILLWR
ncbi:hypothetical protein AYO40_04745 [Planctomycetaceae bacterium SCGC AG-212-D15]|nr:hypothetical protein AYO40_04745 [Planctomycetaceae bacterium SCGC AG-212-D15]